MNQTPETKPTDADWQFLLLGMMTAALLLLGFACMVTFAVADQRDDLRDEVKRLQWEAAHRPTIVVVKGGA